MKSFNLCLIFVRNFVCWSCQLFLILPFCAQIHFLSCFFCKKNTSYGRYVFYWGGGPGLRRGGSLVNILEIGEGQTFLIRSRGRVIVLFGKENITPCRLVDFYLLKNTRSV